MDVGERQRVALELLGRPHVGRGGRERVGGSRDDHAPDLQLRVDLVGDPGRRRRGHQLVVHRLVEVLRGEFLLRRPDAAREKRGVEHGVDLVESQPVRDAVREAFEQRPGVALVEGDHAAVHPAVVGAGQMQRSLVVADGDHRGHAAGEAGVDEPVVECQARLVRGLLVAPGEDAAPGDGESEGGEAHLGEQVKIGFVAVVEVDALELEVVGGGFLRRRSGDALRHDVLDGGQLSVLQVGALQLVRRHGAAPQESFGKGALLLGCLVRSIRLLAVAVRPVSIRPRFTG